MKASKRMTITTIPIRYQYQCKICNKKLTRQIEWIDPKCFVSPKKAHATLAFLCPENTCRTPTAFKSY